MSILYADNIDLKDKKRMARHLIVLGEGNAGQADMVLASSGGLFLLCMIAVSLSIISMVIFACGHRTSGSARKEKGGCCGCCGGSGGGSNPAAFIFANGDSGDTGGGHGHGDGGGGGSAHGHGDGGDGGGCGGGCGGTN